LGRRILTLSIFFVLMAAGAFAVMRLFSTRMAADAPESTSEQAARPLPKQKQTDKWGSTETFMPDAPSGGHFFISASDTRTISSLLSRAAESAGRTASSQDMRARADLLDSLGSFIGIADEMTVYSPLGGGSRIYAAFAFDGAKFDALISGRPARGFRVADRTGGRAGDSWTLEMQGGGELYVTRRRSGERSLVCASHSEEGLGEMERAAKDPSARLSPPRNTDGKNRVSINFATPVMGQGFTIGEAEASWNADGNGIRVNYFTDLSARGSYAPKSDFIPETVRLFGKGSPALFASADPAYILRAVYSGDADPVKAALASIEARMTPVMVSDVEAILKNCRLSIAVVAEDGLIETAYAILDTDELESLERIFSFAGMLLAKTTGPDGWETYDLPMKNGRAFAARMGRSVILGLGDARAYAAETELPANIAGMCAASCGVGVFASSELLSLRAPGTGKTLGETLSEYRPGRSAGWAALVTGMEDMERFSVTHSVNGRGDISITFAEGAAGGSS
jgi:hypothetical protein